MYEDEDEQRLMADRPKTPVAQVKKQEAKQIAQTKQQAVEEQQDEQEVDKNQY